jgi:hypothetical protein
MIQDKINSLKPYFKLFNIADGVAYALIEMPKKWVVPSDISEKFMISTKEVSGKDSGVYFFADMNENTNAIDSVFDSIEYTINFNKLLEERTEVFCELVNRLKEISSTEPVERLRKLQFVLPGDVKKRGRKKKDKKVNNVIEEAEATSVGNMEEVVTSKNVPEGTVGDSDGMLAAANQMLEELNNE